MHALHLLLATPVYFELTLFLLAILAGIVGAILGLGGGIIIIPTLTLLFGVNIRYAIGASIISVIATSSGAAASYVRDRITNIRVAMLLEVATVLGAFSGALIVGKINSQFLYLLFAFVLTYSAITMARVREETRPAPIPDPLALRLRLASSYPDPVLGREVHYSVGHVRLGFFLMLGAGMISALLGIGSGSLKVPAMDRAMGLPIKVSTATSNFMIGVTGATSAGIYFMQGTILPALAAPVAVGVLLGSWFGSWLMVRLPSRQIRKLFVGVLAIIAVQMAARGLGWDFRR